jgi:hypothetical protein
MVQRPKPKSKERPRPKPHFDDKAQSERFIEAARTLGIEETGETFEQAFTKVALTKKLAAP